MYRIGVDVGGMSIKAGLVNEKGKIVDKFTCKTAKDVDDCIADIKNLIKILLNKNYLKKRDIVGVGFGFPGTVTSETCFIDTLANMGWKNVDFKAKMESFNMPIRISNDANVATLGEAKFGVAKGCNNVVMLTIGTGVGGGVIIDGKLFEGWQSKGTELGHTTLIMGGEPCNCGRRGCVESYVSATALIRDTKRAMQENRDSLLWETCENDIENVSGKTLFKAYDKKDETAIKVVNKFVEYLGESIMNMCNIFRPEMVLIGGGISAQGKKLYDAVTKYCKKFDFGYKNATVPIIKTASLGNDAGIIGAASLFFD